MTRNDFAIEFDIILACPGQPSCDIGVNFAQVTPRHANLNGKGVQSQPEEIYYENVGDLDGRQVDLRVTNPNGEYDCEDCRSVMSSELGKINCKSGMRFLAPIRINF